MNNLDRETETQIEKLVEDFRSKITKIVIKNTNKNLKEQAKHFKEEIKNNSSTRKVTDNNSKPSNPSSKPSISSKLKKKNYDTDDDSD
jgi:hypothetical protein